MAVYKAPVRDMRFILNNVFKAPDVWATRNSTKEVTVDIMDAILEEGARLTETEIFPLNRSGDEEGAKCKDGIVTTPQGFKEAWKTLSEGGWVGLGGEPDFGGQGMPKLLTVMFEEMMYAANSSFALYASLTAGSTLCIAAHASDELKNTFLPPLYDGRWAGTMCLTEPHSGSDLGMIYCKAVPNDRGTYNLSGAKSFITGGEHDLCENIVHLVLAKLPDAPAGSRGISLFLVPKFKVNADGSVGDHNNVTCGSIEYKMGIKASSTAVMNFDGAEAFLIGEVNRGLMCMFTMMNYERLSIGLQGIGLGDVSYQSSLEYAFDRIQGRAMKGARNPDKAADPIIVHPDIRRMLLTQKSLTEAGRCFAAYTAGFLDTVKFSEDDEEKKAAADMVALLTPVCKAAFTDNGFEATLHGQMVFGGHGYIREWGMEQLVRDARIAQIYEGTNGIQALDFIDRKIVKSQGKLLEPFYAEVRAFVEDNSNEAMSEFTEPLVEYLRKFEELTHSLLEKSSRNREEVGAAAVEYTQLFSLVAYSYMWNLMVKEALAGGDDDFYLSKLSTARFYHGRVLARADGLIAAIKAGSSSLMDIPESQF